MINQSIIFSEQYKITSKCTIQCRTGHKGIKHLQVPETKPDNKNTKKIIKNDNNAVVKRPMITRVTTGLMIANQQFSGNS